MKDIITHIIESLVPAILLIGLAILAVIFFTSILAPLWLILIGLR